MNALNRAANILLEPQSEWSAIARERSDPKSLYLGYIAILAILPAAASLICTVRGQPGPRLAGCPAGGADRYAESRDGARAGARRQPAALRFGAERFDQALKSPPTR
jgi:hypothetical protein